MFPTASFAPVQIDSRRVFRKRTEPSTGTATATTQHTTTAADTQNPSTGPTTATTDPCHVIQDVSGRSRRSISEDTHNQQTHSSNSV